MKACNHKYVHIRSEAYYTWISRYMMKFVSADYFFCEKCLDLNQVKKEAQCSDTTRDMLPDWAKTITNKIPSEYSI